VAVLYILNLASTQPQQGEAVQQAEQPYKCCYRCCGWRETESSCTWQAAGISAAGRSHGEVGRQAGRGSTKCGGWVPNNCSCSLLKAARCTRHWCVAHLSSRSLHGLLTFPSIIVCARMWVTELQTCKGGKSIKFAKTHAGVDIILVLRGKHCGRSQLAAVTKMVGW